MYDDPMQRTRVSKTVLAFATFVFVLFIGGVTSYGQSDLKIRTFEGHSNGVVDVVVTPDGRYVVSGGRDRTVKLWDLRTGALIHTFEGHANTVVDVAVTPDGRYAVSGSYDQTVRLWDIEMRAR